MLQNNPKNEWNVVNLNDVAEIKRGAGSQYLTYVDQDELNSIRLIRISDFLGDSPKFVCKTKDISRFILKEGDILIAGTGATAGIVFEVPDEMSGLAFSYNAPRIRVSSKVDKKFISLYLKSECILRQQHSLFTGNAQPFLDTKAIGGFKINLPPLPEQKKIAQILSTWDNAISATERLLENSQQRKKALMQQLLTGKKRLPGFEGEWESHLLEDMEEMGLVELGRGNVISKVDIEKNPGSYPIYSSSIKNQGLMGTYGRYMFDEELISWSVDGGGDFFYRPRHKFSVTNVSGYMRLNTSVLNYKFVAEQLILLHQKYAFDYQSKAHPSVIRKLYVLNVPCLAEQQAIASVLTTADQEIAALQKRLGHLKLEKKALMQQLLTGKRRVQVDDAA